MNFASETEEKAFELWVDDFYGRREYDVDEATNYFTDAFCGVYDSEIEFTYQLIDNIGLLADCDRIVADYFDYDAYNYDIFINDYTAYNSGGKVYVFRNI